MNQLNIEKLVKDEKSDWLVMLHGFGGSIKMWKKQIPFFSQRYNLLIIDLPGHGESREGISSKKITKFSVIGDMIVNVLKENNIKTAIFMCVSLGTLVLAGILEHHPEVVSGAILCGAVSGINKVLYGLLEIINKLKVILPYIPLVVGFSYFLLPKRGHKRSRDFFIKSSKLLGKKEFMAWFNLLVKDMNVLQKLNGIKNKVLFVMGDEDFTFIKGVKNKVNDFINGGLKIIHHCGHVCNIQKAEEFNSIVVDYIENTLNLAA